MNLSQTKGSRTIADLNASRDNSIAGGRNRLDTSSSFFNLKTSESDFKFSSNSLFKPRAPFTNKTHSIKSNSIKAFSIPDSDRIQDRLQNAMDPEKYAVMLAVFNDPNHVD